jgi:hypothetical protein
MVVPLAHDHQLIVISFSGVAIAIDNAKFARKNMVVSACNSE